MSKLSAEDWEAWRGNPVTCLMRDLLAEAIQQRKAQALSLYWAGNPLSGQQRRALVLLQEWHEDFFESSFDDVTAMMRKD